MKNSWIIALLLLASCSSTCITSSWKVEEVLPVHYNKIMVVAMGRNTDRNTRQAMEKGMVEQLHRRGYNAVPCIQEHGPMGFGNMNEEVNRDRIQSAAKAAGADALILITLTDQMNRPRYEPGSIYPSSGDDHFRPGANWDWGEGFYSRGSTRYDKEFIWKTGFYETDPFRMAYIAQTQSLGGSADNVAESYGRRIVKNMEDKGVLTRAVKASR